jgi:hypothetical protein
MSASSSARALSRRSYAALILLVALACAAAIAVAMIGHSGTTSHAESGTPVFVKHHPHHPHSNAGYGLDA